MTLLIFLFVQFDIDIKGSKVPIFNNSLLFLAHKIHLLKLKLVLLPVFYQVSIVIKLKVISIIYLYKIFMIKNLILDINHKF